MEEILAKLAESIPSTIAVIVVVVLFIREQARLQKEWSNQMDKAQKEWSNQMNRVVDALDKLSERMTYLESSLNAEAHNRIRPRKNNRNV